MSISFWITKAAFWENTTPAPWPCVWCVQSFTCSPHSLKCEKRGQPSNFLDSISTNAGSRCSRQRSPDGDVLSFKVHWLLIEERSSSQVVEDISHVGVQLELTYFLVLMQGKDVQWTEKDGTSGTWWPAFEATGGKHKHPHCLSGPVTGCPFRDNWRKQVLSRVKMINLRLWLTEWSSQESFVTRFSNVL